MVGAKVRRRPEADVAGLAREQAAHRVVEGQERLARAQGLGAPAGHHGHGGRPRPHPAQELADEGALPGAALAGHEDDAARAGRGGREPLLEPRELGLPADERLAWRAGRRGLCRSRRATKRLGHLPRGGVPLGRLLGQRPADRRVQRRERRGAHEGRGVLIEGAGKSRDCGVARKRPAPGESLVEDDARGEEVGACVDGLAEDLLRRHVTRGPDDQPWAGEVGAAREAAGDLARQLTSQAEIDELAAVGRQEEVGGLDVPVHDARVVKGGQGGEQVLREVERLGRREGLPAQPRRERLSRQQLHGQERPPALLADLEDRAQVRVAHPRGGTGLPDEPSLGRLVLALEHLQRDLPAKGIVLGEEDASHSALPQELDHPVAPDAPRDLRGRRRQLAPTEQPAQEVPASRARGGATVVFGRLGHGVVRPHALGVLPAGRDAGVRELTLGKTPPRVKDSFLSS